MAEETEDAVLSASTKYLKQRNSINQLTIFLRHGLVYAFYPVAHGELVHNLLGGRLEVRLPGLVPLDLRQHHGAAVLLAERMEQVLVQAGVLDVVGRHLLLALDLHADVQPDGARHGRLVRPLLQVVPHVHLAGERPNLQREMVAAAVSTRRRCTA